MHDDLVLMKKGKMMHLKHGELQPMNMVVTFSNGTRVRLDGTIVLPDGPAGSWMAKP